MRQIIVNFLILFLLISCSLGKSQSVEFYTLKINKKNTSILRRPANQKLITIGIAKVSIPAYLNRPQIVLRPENNNKVELTEFHRWAEPLEEGIAQILAQSFNNYNQDYKGKILESPTEDYDYRFEIKIDEFSGKLNDHVQIDAIWALYSKTGKLLTENKFFYQIETKETYYSLTQSLSTLLEKLGEETVDFISSHKQKK